MRFAKDFIKLSEYFGPDDYDRNINFVENLNNTNSPLGKKNNSSAAYSPKKDDKKSSLENDAKNNIRK